MTSISDLPEETLDLILSNLSKQDLKQCQQVCRFLYSSVHILLLQEITLNKVDSIERFIRSIDANPDPSYLKAVKTIILSNTDLEQPKETPKQFAPLRLRKKNIEKRLAVPYRLSKDTIKKLFFRFPNLRKLLIDKSIMMFEDFNDEICQEFLECCPNLDVFEDDSFVNYANIVYKLRLLMTKLNLDSISYDKQTYTGDIIQYITQFPRLRKIIGESDQIHNLEQWLQLLQKLPNLTLPQQIFLHGEHKDNFAEDYLAILTQQEQTALKKQLSQTVQLMVDYPSGYSKNIADFAAKYLTNVSMLHLLVDLQRHWSDPKLLAFCHESLDFIAASKNWGHIIFKNMNVEQVKRYCQIVMDRLFSESNGKPRVVEIQASTGEEMYEDEEEDENDMEMQIIRYEHELVRVHINDQLDIRGISDCLFKRNGRFVPRDDIDEFELCIKNRKEYSLHANSFMYLLLLAGLPSVKKVTMDIPRSLDKRSTATMGNTEDSDYTDDEDVAKEEIIAPEVVCPHVTDLTIRATKKARFQPLLDALANTFPNLQNLEIDYFAGTWNPEKREYQVSLSKYTLQSFLLDVTSVKDKMLKDMMRKSMEEDRTTEVETTEEFLIEVTSTINNQQQLYLVAIDVLEGTFPSVKRIDLSDVQTCANLLCVRVTVGDLRCFGICMYRERFDFDNNYMHIRNNERHIRFRTLFNNIK